MTILNYIYSNIKLKELNNVKSFNIFNLIKDRELKINSFTYMDYTDEQFGDLYIVDIIKNNEDLLMEYLRKVLLEKIGGYD